MSSHLASSASAAVRSVFQTLDENKTGYIDRDIVRKFGQGFKPEWRPRDTARLMRAMDTDKVLQCREVVVNIEPITGLQSRIHRLRNLLPADS